MDLNAGIDTDPSISPAPLPTNLSGIFEFSPSDSTFKSFTDVASKKRVLVQDVDLGAACLKCDSCTGFQLHVWRKICRHCRCPREAHDVDNEEDEEERRKLEWDDHWRLRRKEAIERINKFMRKLERQQNPAHDDNPDACTSLTPENVVKFEAVARKFEHAALTIQVQGPYQHHENGPCLECSAALSSTDAVCIAALDGQVSTAFHFHCFSCHKCAQPISGSHFFKTKDHDRLCKRCYAEELYPRCAGCDELIFDEEYTHAEDQDFHIPHFCCFQCDLHLGGYEYMRTDADQPVCLECYDKHFAPFCATCNQRITLSSDCLEIGACAFHASEACFKCHECGIVLETGREELGRGPDPYLVGDILYCKVHKPKRKKQKDKKKRKKKTKRPSRVKGKRPSQCHQHQPSPSVESKNNGCEGAVEDGMKPLSKQASSLATSTTTQSSGIICHEVQFSASSERPDLREIARSSTESLGTSTDSQLSSMPYHDCTVSEQILHDMDKALRVIMQTRLEELSDETGDTELLRGRDEPQPDRNVENPRPAFGDSNELGSREATAANNRFTVMPVLEMHPPPILRMDSGVLDIPKLQSKQKSGAHVDQDERKTTLVEDDAVVLESMVALEVPLRETKRDAQMRDTGATWHEDPLRRRRLSTLLMSSVVAQLDGNSASEFEETALALDGDSSNRRNPVGSGEVEDTGSSTSSCTYSISSDSSSSATPPASPRLAVCNIAKDENSADSTPTVSDAGSSLSDGLCTYELEQIECFEADSQQTEPYQETHQATSHATAPLEASPFSSALFRKALQQQQQQQQQPQQRRPQDEEHASHKFVQHLCRKNGRGSDRCFGSVQFPLQTRRGAAVLSQAKRAETKAPKQPQSFQAAQRLSTQQALATTEVMMMTMDQTSTVPIGLCLLCHKPVYRTYLEMQFVRQDVMHDKCAETLCLNDDRR